MVRCGHGSAQVGAVDKEEAAMHKVMVVTAAIMWAGVVYAADTSSMIMSDDVCLVMRSLFDRPVCVFELPPGAVTTQTGGVEWLRLAKCPDEKACAPMPPDSVLSPGVQARMKNRHSCSDEKECYKEPPHTVVIEVPDGKTIYRWCYKDPRDPDTGMFSRWVCWKKDD
jgi:hypothetical protein